MLRRFRTAVLGLAAAAALQAAAQQGQPQPLSEWTAANATSYAALGALPNGTSPSNTTALRLGACGFSVDRTYSSWPGISTGALGPGNPFANELDMTGCGACFEVQCGQGNGTSAQSPCIAGAGGNRSSVIITVQDGCPGCPADQLALHPLAFARLANLSRNAIPVRYRQASGSGAAARRVVACQPPENIQVVVEAYNLGGEGWLRLHLEQVGGTGGIQSLWIRSTPSEGSPAATDASLAGLQSQWRQLNNLNSTAAWELNGVPKPPLDLLIYPSLGRPLLATSVIPSSGTTGTFPTDVQVQTPAEVNISTPAASQQPEPDLAGSPASELPAGVQSAPSPAAEAGPAGAGPASEAVFPTVPAAAVAQPSPVPAPAESVAASGPTGGSSTPVVGIAVGAGVGSAVVLGLAAFVWLAAAKRRKRRQAAAGGSSSSGKPSSQDFEAGGGQGGYHAGHVQLAPATAAAAVAAAQPIWDAGSNSYQLAGSLPQGRPPLPPSRHGAGSVQQHYSPAAYGGVHGGGDLLSTFGDQGLMFALDQGGAASYRGTSQLLDSLASTYDEDRLALHQQAASLPRQYHDPYAFTAAAPVGHPVLHATAAPFAGYGSQLQHGYGSASLPPRPPMATRPSSSIAFGGQGDAFGGGLPPLPRPATSGAVYRSTSEWGQLNTSQKEAAQRDLMSTLHEDEMFTSTTQATEGGPAAIPLSAGLPVSRMSGAAHSPALSLDSLRSAVHRGGSARPPTQAMPVPMPASPGAVPQQGEEPLSAWWGDEAQPPYHQEQSLWGPAEGEEAPQPAVQHSLLSQGLHQAGLASAGAYDAGGMGEGALPHASSGGFAPYDMKTSPQKLETASASPPPGSSQSSLPAGQFEGESFSSAEMRPPPGAMPFHIKHGLPAATPPSHTPPSQPAAEGTSRISRPTRLEAFLLSSDSFTSTGNPALFTRDSVDMPAGASYGSTTSYQQPEAPPSQPTRFAAARRAAAADRR